MRDHQMPVLRTVAIVVMAAWGSAGIAAGLGPVKLQSALGQNLRASVPIFGAESPDLAASCITARLEHPDGIVIMPVQASVGAGNDASSIRLVTRQPVREPAAILHLSVACGASLERNYQLLLDPVVTLPQLAQAPQSSPAIATPRRNALGEQAMVSPAEGGVREVELPRRSGQRRASDKAAPAPVAEATPMRSERKTAPARQEPKKVVRSVLKLSSDDVAIDSTPVFSPGLKLSDTLSESRDTGDAQRAAELKSAYARFAMVIRDEDPVTAREKQLDETRAKLQELQQQMATLKAQGEQQRLADQQALTSLERSTVSYGWVAFLASLLAMALAATGWLYLRLKKTRQRQDGVFWESADPATEMDEWGNTLGASDTFATAAPARPAPERPTPAQTAGPDSEPSDWERGIPLDDTLAVDWASRQESLQAPVRQTLKEARARRQQANEENAPPVSGSPAIAQAQEAPAPAELRVVPPAPQAPAVPAASETTDPGAVAATTQKAAAKRNNPAQPMKVEEISDLMQEAEFWMLLNDPERAIEILVPYAGVERPVSPVPWIYLLDLYRVTGQQENYQSLAARIKAVFNTNAPAWSDEDTMAPLRSLRDYPHVVDKIEELWESDDIVPYLESLLLDKRDGARTGFDLAVYREVIHLIGVARDPETSRKREQLNFDDPQPRLISQTVSMPSTKKDKSAPLITEEEADIFDRATSQQATSRQVVSKPAIAKPVAPAPVPVPAAAPVAAPPPAPAPVAAPARTEPAIATAMRNVDEEAPQQKQEPDVAPASTADDDAERTADMARKLDLVEAYQEIGENVGARVLLEEVIQGGTPLQIEKAKAMLKRLLKEIDWQ